MRATKSPTNRFRAEIRNIITEIEACIGLGQGGQDREYRFQRRAFEERCSQAEHLTAALGPAASGNAQTWWLLHDGDAHRVHESLKLSLDYFRRD